MTRMRISLLIDLYSSTFVGLAVAVVYGFHGFLKLTSNTPHGTQEFAGAAIDFGGNRPLTVRRVTGIRNYFHP